MSSNVNGCFCGGEGVCASAPAANGKKNNCEQNFYGPQSPVGVMRTQVLYPGSARVSRAGERVLAIADFI